MTLLDFLALEVALLITYFGGISILITLMVAIAVLIIVRLIRGERAP